MTTSTRPHNERPWSYAAYKRFRSFLCLSLLKEKQAHGHVARLFHTVGTRQNRRLRMVLPNFVLSRSRNSHHEHLLHRQGNSMLLRCVTLGRRPHQPHGHGSFHRRVIKVGNTEEIHHRGIGPRVKERSGQSLAM